MDGYRAHGAQKSSDRQRRSDGSGSRRYRVDSGGSRSSRRRQVDSRNKEDDAVSEEDGTKHWTPAWLTVAVQVVVLILCVVVSYQTPAEGLSASTMLVTGDKYSGLLRICSDSCTAWLAKSDDGASTVETSTSTALIAATWMALYLVLLTLLRRLGSPPNSTVLKEEKPGKDYPGECCGCECLWCIVPFVFLWRLLKSRIEWLKGRAVHMCKTLAWTALLLTFGVAVRVTYLAYTASTGKPGNGVIVVHIIWIALVYVLVKEHYPATTLWPKWCPQWPASWSCGMCKGCYSECLSCGGSDSRSKSGGQNGKQARGQEQRGRQPLRY